MASKESNNTKVTITESDSDVLDAAIESDNETFVTAVAYGAEEEGLDIGSITKWSVLGVVSVVVFVVVLIYYSQFAFNSAVENVNVTSSYYEIEKLESDAREQLTTYGVVDGEAGIYRIPIDEAINKIATD